jgi:hypothetical protein
VTRGRHVHVQLPRARTGTFTYNIAAPTGIPSTDPAFGLPPFSGTKQHPAPELLAVQSRHGDRAADPSRIASSRDGRGASRVAARLRAILAALEASGLVSRLLVREAPEAQREHLERVHEADHVELIFGAAPERGYAYLDPDTSMNPSSLSAALRAAGAVVAATDLVMSGEAKNAFCAVRPPGHHATRERPMGFCIFNNVAVGAMHALEAHGLERVASSTSTCTTATAPRTPSTRIRA